MVKAFDEELNTGEAKKALRKKEADIGQKYNTYVPMIDGKEVTKTELTKIQIKWVYGLQASLVAVNHIF